MKLDISEKWSTVFYVLLGVLLAFGINMVLGQALSTDMPVVAVESNSMVPTFNQGDILVITGSSDPENYENMLNVDDIIVFSVEERDVPIVHRIIEINPDGSYQTRGDANRVQHEFEKHIEPDQIHGKMILIIPYLGWVKIGVTEYILPFVISNILIFAIAAVLITFLYLTVQKYMVKNK